MSSVQTTLSTARQFVREHPVQVQLRGDAANLQHLRQSNHDKFQRLKQQHLMIANLKSSLLATKRALLQSTSAASPSNSMPSSFHSATNSNNNGKKVNPSSLFASSSSRKMSACSQSSASLSSSVASEPFPFHMNMKQQKRWSSSSSSGNKKPMKLKRHQSPPPPPSSSSDEEGTDIESSDMLVRRFDKIRQKDLDRINIIDIYLKAINAVQKHYRKVLMARVKDGFIKLSTLPVITLSHNESSAAYGLVKYPDRLLHAANLEDSLDRCLAKQQCIIHEATTKMPPAISVNMLPSSPSAFRDGDSVPILTCTSYASST